jgi:AraC family transcriptional regulator
VSEPLSVEVKEIGPSTVAFIARRGAFSQIPAAFGALYGWMGARGLAPADMPSGVYYDDPHSVPEADCRWELRSPVVGVVAKVPQDDNGLGVKNVAGYTAAATMYKGPYEAMPPTYESLSAWIMENGYQFTGPPEEVYYSDPAKTAPADYLTEIRFPVRKA